MVQVIGVRFRTAGKIYFFDPGKLEIKKDDHVIVETARALNLERWSPVLPRWRRIRWFSP